MIIGLKIFWTLRITSHDQSTLHSLTTRFEQSGGLNRDAVWLEIISCIYMYRTRDFWSTNILPRHQSTVHKNFSPIESWHLISQCNIISQCHVIIPYVWTVSWTVTRTLSYMWIVQYMWTMPFFLLCSS